MFGSGVLIGTDLTEVLKRSILWVLRQRPIIAVVFVAVRGSTLLPGFRSGALIVSGATQLTRTTTSGFVFPQDWFKVLFSGAAFSGPFSGSGLFALCAYVFLGAFGAENGGVQYWAIVMPPLAAQMGEPSKRMWLM